MNLPVDKSNTSNIATFFTVPANRLKLFDATREAKDATATWIPRYPMLPMRVALALATAPMTPWELWLELHQFSTGRTAQVKTAMGHAMNYALAALIMAGSATRSKMTLVTKPITMPSVRMRVALQRKLAATLGKPRSAAPIVQVQDQSAVLQQSMQLAQQAVDALRARPASGANEYQQGIMHAMRAHTDNLSEPGHKRFTKIQKAALQGFCRVTRWVDVPPNLEGHRGV